MNNISVWKEPKLAPLPASLAPAMRDAQLPLRVEAARKALAECVDLSELLNWKDKAAAIAAAAKAAKMPDIARDARRLQKEALLRLGQLLSEYAGRVKQVGNRGPQSSPRRIVADSVGINERIMSATTRLAAAPRDVQNRILIDDRIPPRATTMARHAPLRGGGRGKSAASIAYRLISQGEDEFGRKVSGSGLTSLKTYAQRVDIALVRALRPDEKKLVRAKVAEIMELLDAIDEACK